MSTEILTEERLDQIEARVAAATPGPWRYDTHNIVNFGRGEERKQICEIPDHPNGEDHYEPEQIAERSAWYKESKANAEFIAYSSTDIPKLVAEVRRLREESHSVYCPACGSCGDTGCCGEKKCLYLSEHHESIADANKLLGDDWDLLFKIVPEAEGIDRYELIGKVQALVSSQESNVVEIEKLRGVIENAEHGRMCSSLYMFRDGFKPCNCWKSKI